MYTQCPHCQTIFGVSEEHLSAAFGRVRCGHCRGQFNAKRHLLDGLPAAPTQAEVAAPDIIEEPPKLSTPAQSRAEELETSLIPSNEIDHIELPNLTTVIPETIEPPSAAMPTPTLTAEVARDDIAPAIQAKHSIQKQPTTPISAEKESNTKPKEAPPSPKAQDQAEKDELDAIFASLDQRLEELSEDANQSVIKPLEKFETGNIRQENYIDAFGDPDSQTEDDIKAGIESIFAAAEAELIKVDTVDDDENSKHNELPEPGLPAEGKVELLGVDEIEQPAEFQSAAKRQVNDVSSTEHEIDRFEPITDDAERDFLYANNDEAVSEQGPYQATQPAFEQEEFPFALHEVLAAEPLPPRSWQKTIGLSIVIVTLLAAIGFQLALFRNVELANKLPPLKPYLVSFCQYLPCQFTGQRDVKRVHLTSRDVRAHPDAKNTILISAIFVNNAQFDQPYPDILITLSDLTTTVVAERRFTPQDYLAKTSAFQLMKSGKPVHITLEVLDPGNDAVNFQFEFL